MYFEFSFFTSRTGNADVIPLRRLLGILIFLIASTTLGHRGQQTVEIGHNDRGKARVRSMYTGLNKMKREKRENTPRHDVHRGLFFFMNSG